MTRLYVNYYQTCIDEFHSGEAYGDWRKEYEFGILDVSAEAPDIYSDVRYEEFDLDVQVGDEVYVLAITYSSGDSFGHATGQGEVLWVFKNKLTARVAYDIWVRDTNKSLDDMYSIRFPVDSGDMVSLSNPASGYFEDLGHVILETHNVIERHVEL